MPFTSYAEPADVEAYVPSASRDLWGGDKNAVQDSLTRAAKRINERFGGLDRFTTIPIEVEDDEEYAEILIEFNVYEAILSRVYGVYSGEDAEDYWRQFAQRYSMIWTGIVEGEYVFGALPEEASHDDKIIYLGRSSV